MRDKSQITCPGLVSAASISAFQADGTGSNPASRSNGQVAQLAVQLTCNQQVASSILVLASKCRYSIMVSISACHAEDTGSNPVTCSIVLHERFLPIPFIKIRILGVYSKPNLVKDFVLQKRIRVGSSPTIYAPRSVLERNPPANSPGGHDFD